MDRRQFLIGAGCVSLALGSEVHAVAAAPPRLLVLIDLMGGNDAANTLIPVSERAYFRARPTIAIPRIHCVPMPVGCALHPALRPLMTMWDAGELSLIGSTGCSGNSLSHHRATEIMDSADLRDDALQPGWVARSVCSTRPGRFAAVQALDCSGTVCGALDGFSRTLSPGHRVDADRATSLFAFPEDALGAQLALACAELAAGCDARVIHAAHGDFDTHERQPSRHADLLSSLAASMLALRNALTAMGRWRETLLMTRSEFGRLGYENLCAGTDHGNAGVQILAGGRIRGGIYGRPLTFDALDGRGGFLPDVDFRSVCRAVASGWIGAPVHDEWPAAPALAELFST